MTQDLIKILEIHQLILVFQSLWRKYYEQFRRRIKKNVRI